MITGAEVAHHWLAARSSESLVGACGALGDEGSSPSVSGLHRFPSSEVVGGVSENTPEEIDRVVRESRAELGSGEHQVQAAAQALDEALGVTAEVLEDHPSLSDGRGR